MARRLLALVALLVIGSLRIGLRIALLAQPPATIEEAVAAALNRTGAPSIDHPSSIPLLPPDIAR